MEAAATTMADITTALTTGMTDVATQALAAIKAIVPVAIPVFGGLVLVSVAKKAITKFTGR